MREISDLLRRASEELVESDTALLDVQLLLTRVLDVDRVWLLTWSDKEISADQEANFLKLVERRKSGEPIAYILGKREFWGREFACNEHTLIPRPDTERLIELVLELDLPDSARVLDLGTGTGCIGLTLAAEKPAWQVMAVDYSEDALKIAEQNRRSLNLDNATLIQSDWYQSMGAGEKFDLIVANPPYIDPDSPYLNEGDVRFEPDAALTSENKGLSALRAVISHAPKYLKPNGRIAVEHGFDQAVEVRQILQESGFQNIEQAQDLAGLDRCSIGKLAG